MILWKLTYNSKNNPLKIPEMNWSRNISSTLGRHPYQKMNKFPQYSTGTGKTEAKISITNCFMCFIGKKKSFNIYLLIFTFIPCSSGKCMNVDQIRRARLNLILNQACSPMHAYIIHSNNVIYIHQNKHPLRQWCSLIPLACLPKYIFNLKGVPACAAVRSAPSIRLLNWLLW